VRHWEVALGSRTTTREALVAAATALFLARGLGPVAMEEVAAAAGCTRRTLYRYFAAKEELAYEAAIALLEGWNRTQEDLFDRSAGTGAQRLRVFLDGTVAALEGRRDQLRFLGEFDFVFRDAAGFRPDSDRAGRFLAASGRSEDLVGRILLQGEADGTLRLPAPLNLLVPTLTTVLWGLAQRVALRDEHIAEEFGVAGLDLVRTQIDLILLALKGEPHGPL